MGNIVLSQLPVDYKLNLLNTVTASDLSITFI